MFLPQQVIQRKRDGHPLSDADIQMFASGLANGDVEDSQAAAFAMAVFFQGMSLSERVTLTLSMRDSGVVIPWDDCQLNGPVIDKHSTGGVGDVVSLMLGPMLAACGGYVPMISGRGLGHTGGTVDKLESIPGYATNPSVPRLKQIVADVGVAIIGQTDDIAPADRRLYGIRDITGTVESIDLITASILSKKLAAGLEALVMDVKVGNGAFMPTRADSQALAQSIVDVASLAGTPTTAVLTDMSQCLANSAGNAVEVREALQFLKGDLQSPRLAEVTEALGVELLQTSGLAENETEARSRVRESIASGAAAERFARMTHALGGPADILENGNNILPQASIQAPVYADRSGIVQSIDVRALGIAVLELGGGRTKAGQAIDPAVGLTEVCSIGETADSTRPLAVVHASTQAKWENAKSRIQAAFRLGEEQVGPPPAVERVIRPKNTRS